MAASSVAVTSALVSFHGRFKLNDISFRDSRISPTLFSTLCLRPQEQIGSPGCPSIRSIHDLPRPERLNPRFLGRNIYWEVTMRKTVLSLITAGLVGTIMVPAAHAITPGATGMQTDQPGTQNDQSTLKQQQARLRHDHALLKRDVRLGKTSEARKMRREINADERAIRQARSGVQQNPNAKSMQPQQQMIPPQNQNQTNTNTTEQTPTNKQ